MDLERGGAGGRQVGPIGSRKGRSRRETGRTNWNPERGGALGSK